MTVTLKVNARNDIHLPSDVLKALNLGVEKIIKVELKGNCLLLTPADLEPRYSFEELEGLDKLHEEEKKKGWIHLGSEKDIDRLVKIKASR